VRYFIFGVPATFIVALLALTVASPVSAFPDFDGDGVPDALDQCFADPEDLDAIRDDDGCPDTDVTAQVIVQQAFSIPAGDVQTKTIAMNLVNGNHPANIRVTMLAVSPIGFCEVTILPESGDLNMDFHTDENGDMVDETFYSHVEWVEVDVGAGEVRPLSRDYEVQCSEPGTFPDAYELQVDVLPLSPVQDEDLTNNVHTNFPDVTVTGTAIDSDGDGFGNGVETFVGSLAAVSCAGDPAANNESGPDAWPVDLDDNQRVNTVDVGHFVSRLGASRGDANYTARYDFTYNGLVNTVDVGGFVGHLGANCGA
jgi:hypothetical protein